MESKGCARIKPSRMRALIAAFTVCLRRKVHSLLLSKICWSSWWEWEAGSSLFFWRWGEELRLARDGMIPFVTNDLPKNFKKGRSLEDNEHFEKIIEKLLIFILT